MRSYSQTTAMWLRGILAESFGVAADTIEWVTFEDAHVANIEDPPYTVRAPVGADPIGMLRAGKVDAAIVGNDLPDGDDLRTVFSDPASSAAEFFETHGVVPPNHLLTVRGTLATARPDLVAELVRIFRMSAADVPTQTPDAYPTNWDAIEMGVELARRFASTQGMLAAALTPDQVWAGVPTSLLG